MPKTIIGFCGTFSHFVLDIVSVLWYTIGVEWERPMLPDPVLYSNELRF